MTLRCPPGPPPPPSVFAVGISRTTNKRNPRLGPGYPADVVTNGHAGVLWVFDISEVDGRHFFLLAPVGGK